MPVIPLDTGNVLKASARSTFVSGITGASGAGSPGFIGLDASSIRASSNTSATKGGNST
jgi:hypothetical protein